MARGLEVRRLNNHRIQNSKGKQQAKSTDLSQASHIANTLPSFQTLMHTKFKELITGWYAIWRRQDVIAAVALILGCNDPISSLELAIQRLCNCRTSLTAIPLPAITNPLPFFFIILLPQISFASDLLQRASFFLQMSKVIQIIEGNHKQLMVRK